MTIARALSLGLVLTVLVSFAGCGEGGDAGPAPVDQAQPDAGVAKSKEIMQMQPPPASGKKSGRS